MGEFASSIGLPTFTAGSATAAKQIDFEGIFRGLSSSVLKAGVEAGIGTGVDSLFGTGGGKSTGGGSISGGGGGVRAISAGATPSGRGGDVNFPRVKQATLAKPDSQDIIRQALLRRFQLLESEARGR